MCSKPDFRIKENIVQGGYRKDNQPEDGYSLFTAIVRPCVCGKSVLGSVPGGHFWYEVEGVKL